MKNKRKVTPKQLPKKSTHTRHYAEVQSIQTRDYYGRELASSEQSFGLRNSRAAQRNCQPISPPRMLSVTLSRIVLAFPAAPKSSRVRFAKVPS